MFTLSITLSKVEISSESTGQLASVTSPASSLLLYDPFVMRRVAIIAIMLKTPPKMTQVFILSSARDSFITIGEIKMQRRMTQKVLVARKDYCIESSSTPPVGTSKDIATSENRIKYIVHIPNTAMAMRKLTTTEAPGMMQMSVNYSRIVLHFSIALDFMQSCVETKRDTTTKNCTLSPTGMLATAYANGIDTIPPPIIVDTMADPVSIAEFSSFYYGF